MNNNISNLTHNYNLYYLRIRFLVLDWGPLARQNLPGGGRAVEKILGGVLTLGFFELVLPLLRS
jgi:hypothetical protein